MNSDVREWTYRHYIANSLMIIPEGNKLMTHNLEEVLYPERIDNRKGDEVVEDVMKDAGLTWEN